MQPSEQSSVTTCWCDPGPMSWVRIRGSDAVRFVENFTTAAVGRLADGKGCEGFFTDVRGQVICMAGLLRCGADSGEEPAVEIVADGDVGGMLSEHLERYHIREPIEIEDLSPGRCTLALLGAGVEDALATCFDGDRPVTSLTSGFDHAAFTLKNGQDVAVTVRLMRCDWAGPHAWLLACRAEDRSTLEQTLANAGAVAADPSAWDTARIEAGTPRHHDLLPKTLPQELDRDDRAISFTKGCYLGQETVARLDALGHVNRRLVGLAVEGDAVPSVGAEITAANDSIGHVTSSCFSTHLARPLVLATLPVKPVATAALSVAGIPAQRVELPLTVPQP